MASRVAADLSDLSNNIDNVDLWLKGLSDTADVMSAQHPELQVLVFAARRYGLPPQFHFDALIWLHYYRALGTIYYNGYWLVPALESIS